MAQNTKQTTRRSTRGPALRTVSQPELMRAKLALVAASERDRQGALGRVLAEYPALVPELAEFSAGLIATTSYEHELPTPEVDALAERALTRAFAAVFPAQAATVSAPAAVASASLQALRKARHLTQLALASRLGLGVDVLGGLEHGLIKVATIPERLVHALGEALGASADQVHNILQVQGMSLPALNRMDGQSKHAALQPELDFSQAVALSPNMTAEQKAAWLAQ